MLTEPITNSTALEGIVVTLVAQSVPNDFPLPVKVREPIWPQREWCNADVLVKARTKEITLVLRPRPLLTKAANRSPSKSFQPRQSSGSWERTVARSV